MPENENYLNEIELESKLIKKQMRESDVLDGNAGVNISGVLSVYAENEDIAKRRAKIFLKEKYCCLSVSFIGKLIAEKDSLFSSDKNRYNIAFSIAYTGSV